VVENVVIDI